jgi:hypothetical protein
MLKTVLAVALLCALTINAEARERHKTYLAHPDCNVVFPCEGVAPSPRGLKIERSMPFGAAQKVYTPRAAVLSPLYPKSRKISVRTAANKGQLISAVRTYGAPSPSFDYSIGRPARYIAGRLICAVNVNAALAERGIRGTGSALALSFRHWGRSAGGPVPGAVIVSSRRGGGHVAIVSRVENGVIYAWNATGGQRGWREIPYRHHVIDYRVPG